MATTNNDEIYWTVPQIYDYLSILGLNTKFGLNSTDFDIFTIKELIDNALDKIEENARDFVNGKRPFIHVIITEEEENGEVIKIKVRNSNAGKKNIFTEERVKQIFTLQNYHGNKRYTHKINRGELGDALKAILCIPYAIVVNNNNDQNNNNNNKYHNWNYPLEINVSSDKKSIKIRIDNIEKIRKKEMPYIDIKYEQFHNDDDKDEEEIINDYNHFTEIVVYLPKTAVNDYDEIDELLKKYAVLNTHIDFKFKLPFSKKPDFYPATQRIKNDWRNKESIYSYTLSEIKDYFQGIDKNHDNLNVYDNFLYTNFREGTTLSKKDDEILKNLTIGDLKSDYKKIEYIVQKMKVGMKPIKKQSGSLPKLDLPFDIEKREQALNQRLKDEYLIEDFVYKRFDRYHENSDTGVQYPYKLEVVIANSPVLNEKRLTLIESLNFSPSLHTDSLFTTTNNNWIFHLKDFVTNNLSTILKQSGYSLYNEKDHKKPYNLIVVNLISPRVDYNSHSKSNINLEPFAKIFANEFYKFCKSPNNKNKDSDVTENNLYHLRIWLNKRWEAVQKDPTLLTTGRVTLDGVYYRLRLILDQLGIPIRDREYIKSSIRDICEKEMGLKRDQLGIIAAERAQFYYKGRSYGVGIDEISELIQYAADIVIIEKEGAAETLRPFADKYGIALLYTRGFGTEYALELTERTDSNIIVLTDLDASGLLMQTKLPSNKKIYRVGVNQQMLDYFGIDFDDVSETYDPKSHYEEVHKYLEKYGYNIISKELFKRLKTERVEIDSVLSNVSNEEFWNYIIEFLEEKFPNRNYNRSIDVPKSVTPIYLQKFIDNSIQIIIKAQEQERQKIVNELEYTEGLFDELEDKENEIEDRLRSTVENDQEIKNKISEEFKKVFIN